ncbi:hypothetical protein H6G00_00765 [Leptolyngbya sp. FACHB-541]|uniref:hypothetical protein n=1 Tax=Leptolyngbya sp. FACHB-541 TaxID=2692810 RepID=UPI00168A19E3|nr:hypothetical protein [Leptolyngbya sp. FACHB-541]MBD1995159.1 hypothetical protein [Leptolyngbya sp. FACHB-541]
MRAGLTLHPPSFRVGTLRQKSSERRDAIEQNPSGVRDAANEGQQTNQQNF